MLKFPVTGKITGNFSVLLDFLKLDLAFKACDDAVSARHLTYALSGELGNFSS
jgi:hypothetical protein